MKKTIFLPLIFLLSSCIPNTVKEEMGDAMVMVQQMMADAEFKKAIGHIELHKLRNGNYPASLSELQFLSKSESFTLKSIDYTRLDSVYKLNLKMKAFSIDGKGTKPIALKYPADFWRGLGCVKSNLK